MNELLIGAIWLIPGIVLALWARHQLRSHRPQWTEHQRTPDQRVTPEQKEVHRTLSERRQ